MRRNKIKNLQNILLATNQYGGDMFYPPAAIWEENIGIKDARRAWQQLAENINSKTAAQDKVGLYLHIPFCVTKCLYCNCISIPQSESNIHESYLDCIEREIIALKIPKGIKIKTFCIGGGTPSILSAKNLEKMFKLARDNFNLSECEQTMIEISPSTITPDKIKVLKNNAVNKITIGVQMLDEKLLCRYNRPQTKKMVFGVYKKIREAGIKYINIDLLAGLHGQNISSFLKDLDEIIKLKPDTIHINPFAPLFFTPYAMGGGNYVRGDVERRMEMVELGNRRIAESYPFAQEREGHEKENQQLFNIARLNSSVIGLGWGALSHARSFLQYAKKNYLKNYKNLNRGLDSYIKNIKRNKFPIFYGCRIGREEEMRGNLIRSLETEGIIEKRKFADLFGEDPVKIFPQEFKLLEELGAIKKNRNDIIEIKAESRLDYFIYSMVFYAEKHIRKIRKSLKGKILGIESARKKLEINFCNEPILY